MAYLTDSGELNGIHYRFWCQCNLLDKFTLLLKRKVHPKKVSPVSSAIS